MKNIHFKSHVLFILFLVIFNKSYGQPSTISENQINSNIHYVIDSLLNKGFQDKMFPGVGIALFKNDSTQFFNYGHAKIESNVAVSKKTKFQLGSIGKLITAISVLQLVDQGKL